jgi:transposase
MQLKTKKVRTLGKNFNEHHSTIGKFLKKFGFSYRKRQKIPKYTEKQLKTMTSECRKLLQSIFKEKKNCNG